MADSDNIGGLASLALTGYTSFADILECSLTMDRGEVDYTLASADNGALKTYYPNKNIEAEMDAKIIFTPSAAPTGLMSGAPASIDLQYNDASNTIYRFSSAFVRSVSIGIPVGERMEMDCSLRLSGTWTVTSVP